MLKFGFIGFGQVGGLFADDAKLRGHQSLAINTATVDLNSLKNLDNQEKIHLIGYGGAGKDRSIGEEAFLNNQEILTERIQEKFEDCQIIFPIFALGGGTGSGMSSFATRMLTEIFEEKVISPICFLPDRTESPRANMNALESFSELSAIEDIGSTFIFDNQKVNELNHSFNLKERHKNVRTEFLDMIHYLNTITEKESDFHNLDKMDLLTAFSERGSAMLTRIQIDETDVKEPSKLGNRLERSLIFSPYAKTDLSQLTKASVVAEVPTNLTTDLQLDIVFESIGIPLEVFTGIYENNEEPFIQSLLTGLPFPTDSLKSMEEEIRKKEDKILKKLTNARSQSFDVKSSWTNSLKRNRRVKL